MICEPIQFPQYGAYLETENEENVIFQNSLQLRSCYRHLFSVDEEFTLAEKYLMEYPELRKLERQRMGGLRP